MVSGWTSKAAGWPTTAARWAGSPGRPARAGTAAAARARTASGAARARVQYGVADIGMPPSVMRVGRSRREAHVGGRSGPRASVAAAGPNCEEIFFAVRRDAGVTPQFDPERTVSYAC